MNVRHLQCPNERESFPVLVSMNLVSNWLRVDCAHESPWQLPSAGVTHVTKQLDTGMWTMWERLTNIPNNMRHMSRQQLPYVIGCMPHNINAFYTAVYTNRSVKHRQNEIFYGFIFLK